MGGRLIRWVQKTKLGTVAETGDLEWQDRCYPGFSPRTPPPCDPRKTEERGAPNGAPRFLMWPPPLSSLGFPNLGSIAVGTRSLFVVGAALSIVSPYLWPSPTRSHSGHPSPPSPPRQPNIPGGQSHPWLKPLHYPHLLHVPAYIICGSGHAKVHVAP